MGFKTAQGSTAHAQDVLKIENLCATAMSGGQLVWSNGVRVIYRYMYVQ